MSDKSKGIPVDYKPGWSPFYNTPVKRLLFLCGLKVKFEITGVEVWTIRRQPMEL